MEENLSNEEHFREVQDREERATKESTSLKQQLKLERAERERDLAEVRRQERMLRGNLQLVEERYQTSMASTTFQAERERQSALNSYEDDRSVLIKEITALEKKLNKTREENAAAEQNARQKKNQNIMTVQDWLRDYDANMYERDAEFQQQQQAYEKVTQELLEKEGKIEIWKAEREAYEEALFEQRLEEFKIKMELRKQENAARTIQAKWREFIGGKKKKGKKGKGKGKKK